jgi:hypothetical protein
MPDEIQDKIFVKTIAKYKVGDSFGKLDTSVPGYFDNWVYNGNGGVNSSEPLIDYELEVRKDTITKLNMTAPKTYAGDIKAFANSRSLREKYFHFANA